MGTPKQKLKIAIIRGSFANPYELQNFEPLINRAEIVIFGGKRSIITPVKVPLRRLNSLYDLTNQRFIRGAMNRLLVDMHYLFGLEENLRGFDIAHSAETYFRYTQQCLDAKKKGLVKKVVVTVWENIPFNNEGIRGRKELKRRVFNEADVFLAVSQKAKQALIIEGCDKEKITILHPGIDLNRFSPRKIGNNKNILFVGRLVEEKGVRILSKVTSMMKQEFHVIGAGPLSKLFEHQPNVILSTITYDKMPQMYQNAKIFVLPSIATSTWEEQYGMVLLEAMASGLPIVTYDTGSIKEIVGDCALFAKPEDPSDLAAKISGLINSPRLLKKMSYNSRVRAEKLFDRNKIAKSLEKIYKSL